MNYIYKNQCDLKRNIKVEIKNFKLKIYIFLIISIFYKIKYKAFQN